MCKKYLLELKLQYDTQAHTRPRTYAFENF